MSGSFYHHHKFLFLSLYVPLHCIINLIFLPLYHITPYFPIILKRYYIFYLNIVYSHLKNTYMYKHIEQLTITVSISAFCPICAYKYENMMHTAITIILPLYFLIFFTYFLCISIHSYFSLIQPYNFITNFLYLFNAMRHK